VMTRRSFNMDDPGPTAFADDLRLAMPMSRDPHSDVLSHDTSERAHRSQVGSTRQGPGLLCVPTQPPANGSPEHGRLSPTLTPTAIMRRPPGTFIVISRAEWPALSTTVLGGDTEVLLSMRTAAGSAVQTTPALPTTDSSTGCKMLPLA